MPKNDDKKQHGRWLNNRSERDAGESVKWTSMRWMGLGLEIAGLVVLFSYLGWRLDEKLEHHFPVLMISGFVIAFVGRIYLLFKETKQQRED